MGGHGQRESVPGRRAGAPRSSSRSARAPRLAAVLQPGGGATTRRIGFWRLRAGRFAPIGARWSTGMGESGMGELPPPIATPRVAAGVLFFDDRGPVPGLDSANLRAGRGADRLGVRGRRGFPVAPPTSSQSPDHGGAGRPRPRQAGVPRARKSPAVRGAAADAPVTRLLLEDAPRRLVGPASGICRA